MFYESSAIEISWNGIDLSEGIAADSFLSIVPLGNRIEETFGADGDMAVSKQANKGATITLTLQQTSETNKKIAKIAFAQDITGGKIPVKPFRVVDHTGNSANFLAHNAFLKTNASHEFGANVGEKTWVFVCQSFITAEDPSTITSAISNILPAANTPSFI